LDERGAEEVPRLVYWPLAKPITKVLRLSNRKDGTHTMVEANISSNAERLVAALLVITLIIVLV
jgi:hypothetical protein